MKEIDNVSRGSGQNVQNLEREYLNKKNDIKMAGRMT